MRTASIVVPLLAALGGCAVVPPSAWSFDPDQPRAKVAVPAQQFAALSDRARQLQARRAQIQARIAAERDVWQRQRDYEELHRVGMELSPLERKLAGVAPAS